MKPRYEVAQIIRDYGDDFIRVNSPLKHHQRVLGAIKICRTVELGGHIDRCGDCGHERISYNSCRNRHCPKCQNTNRERWLLLSPSNTFLLSSTYPVIPYVLNS